MSNDFSTFSLWTCPHLLFWLTLKMYILKTWIYQKRHTDTKKSHVTLIPSQHTLSWVYLDSSALLPLKRHLSYPRLSKKLLLCTFLGLLTAELSYLRQHLKAAARSLGVPRVQKQNNRIVLRLRSGDRVLHPFNFSGRSVFRWRGGVCVCVCVRSCAPVSSMAPRAVWLLVALSAVVNVRSCCAFSCPAICRCSQHTFQCSRDTQLASRAAARAVARLWVTRESITANSPSSSLRLYADSLAQLFVFSFDFFTLFTCPTDGWHTCLWKKSPLTLSRSSSTLLRCEFFLLFSLTFHSHLMGRLFTYKSSYISKCEALGFSPKFEIIFWHLQKEIQPLSQGASSDGASVHSEHSRHVLWGSDNTEMSSAPFQTASEYVQECRSSRCWGRAADFKHLHGTCASRAFPKAEPWRGGGFSGRPPVADRNICVMPDLKISAVVALRVSERIFIFCTEWWDGEIKAQKVNAANLSSLFLGGSNKQIFNFFLFFLFFFILKLKERLSGMSTVCFLSRTHFPVESVRLFARSGTALISPGYLQYSHVISSLCSNLPPYHRDAPGDWRKGGKGALNGATAFKLQSVRVSACCTLAYKTSVKVEYRHQLCHTWRTLEERSGRRSNRVHKKKTTLSCDQLKISHLQLWPCVWRGDRAKCKKKLHIKV